MAVAASTPWCLPPPPSPSVLLHASSVAPPSSFSLKNNCQLLNSSAHHDLLSSSSRRASIDSLISRSAGSFRSLIPPSPPFDAFPWPSSCFDESMMPCSSPSFAKVLGVDGELTAADVDLLPMPGLAASYPYFSLGSSDSVLTRISSSESMSTANSGKFAGMMSNFLGLPPNFTQDGDDGMVFQREEIAKSVLEVPTKTPASKEQDAFRAHWGGEINLSQLYGIATSSITNLGHAEEDDNFAGSLARFWNEQAMNCEPDTSLDSILTNLPQKFHSVSSGPTITPSDVENCVGKGFALNELEYLAIPTGEKLTAPSEVENRNESTLLCDAWNSEAVTVSIPQSGSQASTTLQLEGKEALEDWSSSEQEGSQTSANADNKIPTCSSETGFNASSLDFQTRGSIFTTSLPVKMETSCTYTDSMGNVSGKKRPFSIFQLPSFVSTPTLFASAGADVCSSQPESIELMQGIPGMSYNSATQALSAMLYKSQGGQARHLITSESMELKPPPSKVRRRHGTAMDPQSIAARTRRERFSDRIRILQSLVPNGERLDTVSMLGQTLEYVRFLQHQVWQLYHGLDPASPANIKSEKWKDFLEAQTTSN